MYLLHTDVHTGYLSVCHEHGGLCMYTSSYNNDACSLKPQALVVWRPYRPESLLVTCLNLPDFADFTFYTTTVSCEHSYRRCTGPPFALESDVNRRVQSTLSSPFILSLCFLNPAFEQVTCFKYNLLILTCMHDQCDGCKKSTTHYTVRNGKSAP